MRIQKKQGVGSLVRMRSAVQIRPSAPSPVSQYFQGLRDFLLPENRCQISLIKTGFANYFSSNLPQSLTNTGFVVSTFANYINFLASSKISSLYLTYLFSVVSVLLCPSILAITSRSMPFSLHSVAQVSLKSCGVYCGISMISWNFL